MTARQAAEWALFEHKSERGWNHDCDDCDRLWQAVVDAWQQRWRGSHSKRHDGRD